MIAGKVFELITKLSEEFNAWEGGVTCETSVHKDDLPELFDFINKNIIVEDGAWMASSCTTCEEYNGEGFVHVEIVSKDFVNEVKNSSNWIRGGMPFTCV
jgi:hypothetical protein